MDVHSIELDSHVCFDIHVLSNYLVNYFQIRMIKVFHLWTWSFFSIFPSSKKAKKANLGFLKLKKLESKVKNLTFMYINQSVTTQTAVSTIKKNATYRYSLLTMCSFYGN
jgi:hypothetical protein